MASGSADATVRLWLVAYDTEASGLQGRCNRSCAAVPSGGAWVGAVRVAAGGGRRKWLRRALGGTAGALSRAIALRQSVGRVVGPAGGAARGLGVVCIVYRVSLVECGTVEGCKPRLTLPCPRRSPPPLPPSVICHCGGQRELEGLALVQAQHPGGQGAAAGVPV